MAQRTGAAPSSRSSISKPVFFPTAAGAAGAGALMSTAVSTGLAALALRAARFARAFSAFAFLRSLSSFFRPTSPSFTRTSSFLACGEGNQGQQGESPQDRVCYSAKERPVGERRAAERRKDGVGWGSHSLIPALGVAVRPVARPLQRGRAHGAAGQACSERLSPAGGQAQPQKGRIALHMNPTGCGAG